MRHATYARALLAAATAALFLLPAAPSAARAPACLGEKATIVGTPGDDELTGTRGDDVIVGLGGVDELRGRGGDDVICAGPGRARDGGDVIHREYLWGGPGDDVLVGGRGADVVIGGDDDDDLRGGASEDDLLGHSGRDRLSGGRDHDELAGGPGGDTLQGGGDDDLLEGDAGSDALVGDDGDDLLAGGGGDDDLDGGTGSDLADYRSAPPLGPHRIPVTVDLPAGQASAPDHFGTDDLVAIEGARTGGGGDTLVGDEGDNEFLPGAPWYDGAVQDTISGGGGHDHLDFADDSYAGPVTLDLAAGTGDQQSGSTLLVSGIEDVTGTSHDDVLVGDDGPNRLAGFRIGANPSFDQGDRIDGAGGDDALWGHGGDDELDGGPGTNTVDGGEGSDTCRNPGPGQMGATGCEL